MPPLDYRPRNSRGMLLNLGWTLRRSVAALVCAAGHGDPNPPPLVVR
jgi:hypothetical protein